MNLVVVVGILSACVIAFVNPFCESFVAPSAFRQALPANGADGEAPLKVVGLRGARAARAKPRTCFGRRLDGGFSE